MKKTQKRKYKEGRRRIQVRSENILFTVTFFYFLWREGLRGPRKRSVVCEYGHCDVREMGLWGGGKWKRRKKSKNMIEKWQGNM
jgi:hypothetical protein